jgi:hypothetical protein
MPRRNADLEVDARPERDRTIEHLGALWWSIPLALLLLSWSDSAGIVVTTGGADPRYLGTFWGWPFFWHQHIPCTSGEMRIAPLALLADVVLLLVPIQIACVLIGRRLPDVRPLWLALRLIAVPIWGWALLFLAMNIVFTYEWSVWLTEPYTPDSIHQFEHSANLEQC